MKILIPIISRKEGNEEFIDKALEKTKELILLVVIDTALKLDDIGFTANNILLAREISEKISNKAKKKKIKVEELIEWGSTKNKIIQIAKLKKAEKIVFLKQENKFFEEIINQLKNEGLTIEIIEVKEEIPKK